MTTWATLRAKKLDIMPRPEATPEIKRIPIARWCSTFVTSVPNPASSWVLSGPAQAKSQAITLILVSGNLCCIGKSPCISEL